VDEQRNKAYRMLPLLIIWGVWLARNTLIFKEVYLAPEITTLKSLAISPHTYQLLGESRQEIFRRSPSTKQNLGVFFTELPKIIDVGEEGFYISQIPTTSH
jgi:hypothetical protein